MVTVVLSGFFILIFALFPMLSSESNGTLPEIPLKRCAQVNRVIRPRYHLVRRCSRSDARVLASANFSSLWRCTDFAMFKSGLALNFGWRQGGLGHCEVLECPEHDTLSSLRRRENYDYYSLYTNPMPATDWHCVPKLGVFRIGHGEANSESQRKCQDWALMHTPRNKTDNKETGSSTGENSGVESGTPMSASSSVGAEFTGQTLRRSRSAQTETHSYQPKFTPPIDKDIFLSPEFIPEEWVWSTEYKERESLNNNASSDSTSTRLAGRLGDVLSPDRTTNLTKFLLSKEGKYFSPVLVGLATTPSNPQVFATPLGEPLPCFRFRAWAPGHPLPSKRFKAVLLNQNSTPRSSTNTTVNETVTTKDSSTKSNSTESAAKTQAMHTNDTSNATVIASARRLAEKRRDEMTLCVYLRHDGLWQTGICSMRTAFLCELLPSGGPCRDANSSDERATCEYEKIGSADERCSAWKDEMITTTMMPIEPDKGQDGGNDEDNNEEGNSGDSDDNENDYGDNDDDSNSYQYDDTDDTIRDAETS